MKEKLAVYSWQFAEARLVAGKAGYPFRPMWSEFTASGTELSGSFLKRVYRRLGALVLMAYVLLFVHG